MNRSCCAGLAALAILLASCNVPEEVEVPITLGPTPTAAVKVVTPTPEPPPPKTLIVCLENEPSSLYLYGDTSPEADAILQAIYDGPVDLLDYAYSSVILSKLPSIADGDARVQAISVTEGDIYLNPETAQPDNLGVGKSYIPSGCLSAECIQAYQGGEVAMEQMVVEYRLSPGLVWSDGEPLTAHDSVFSYHLDQHPDTPTTKYVVSRTAAYTAVDDRTTRWVGIPGFFDAEYASNFWTPLPMHLLGESSAKELLDAQAAARLPIGWGAYRIKEWLPGQQVVLEENDQYYRSGEGLPNFEIVIFRFLGDQIASAFQQVLTGECDILDPSAVEEDQLSALVALAESGKLQLTSVSGPLVERFDFNLEPPPGQLPLFGDVRTRLAVAACTDRERVAEAATSGLGFPAHSYLPPGHPLAQEEGQPEGIDFDPGAATALLEEAGWVDEDGDPQTARVARGVLGIADGTPLTFRFSTTPSAMHEAMAGALQESLQQCGISIQVDLQAANELFASWPDGLAFGRRFETVGWAWPALVSPPCEMFAGFEVPSESRRFGINASGFRHAEYDQACRTLLIAPAWAAPYPEAVSSTLRILAEQAPTIPLFAHPRILVAAKDICGLRPDPSAFSALWNLEVLDRLEECP
ncbi:MAG TPA: ABC transporter substrate-binding protein [Anaerolineales bacterium]|nr:ABC transporter substrate-binding protein [Anaerolineales bacterium]